MLMPIYCVALVISIGNFCTSKSTCYYWVCYRYQYCIRTAKLYHLFKYCLDIMKGTFKFITLLLIATVYTCISKLKHYFLSKKTKQNMCDSRASEHVCICVPSQEHLLVEFTPTILFCLFVCLFSLKH